MPGCLNFRLRQEAEEFCDALVFIGWPVAQHPQCRAADNGVLRRAGDIRPIWQHAVADLEFRIGLDVGAGRRRADEDSAFAVLKPGLRGLRAAAIVERFRRLPFHELRDMAHHQRIVERQDRIKAAKAVGVGRDRQVVKCGKILDIDP